MHRSAQHGAPRRVWPACFAKPATGFCSRGAHISEGHASVMSPVWKFGGTAVQYRCKRSLGRMVALAGGNHFFLPDYSCSEEGKMDSPQRIATSAKRARCCLCVPCVLAVSASSRHWKNGAEHRSTQHGTPRRVWSATKWMRSSASAQSLQFYHQSFLWVKFLSHCFVRC